MHGHNPENRRRQNKPDVLWNTKPDGTGTDLDDYGACTGPVTFYAVYYQSDYSYVGAPQTFVAPVDGTYRIQLWGAQGGADAGGPGGKGGFVTGSVKLKAHQILYVYVGAPGRDNGTGIGAGYNGGANSGGVGWSGAGGGATSISLVGGPWNNAAVLANRIMVAGGGGGWYGGGSGRGDRGAGGGSSFINGACGCVNRNTNFTFFNAAMIDGRSVMPSPLGGTEYGHSGGCYAYINLIAVE